MSLSLDDKCSLAARDCQINGLKRNELFHKSSKLQGIEYCNRANCISKSRISKPANSSIILSGNINLTAATKHAEGQNLDTRVSTFEKDTPIGHPQANGFVALFVPVAGSEAELPSNVRNGAGIIGFGNPNGTLTIYFESNRFNETSLHLWETKVRTAYRRMIDHLPTTSKAVIPPHQLEQVGTMGAEGLRLTRFDSLKRWLAYSKLIETAPESEHLNWD